MKTYFCATWVSQEEHSNLFEQRREYTALKARRYLCTRAQHRNKAIWKCPDSKRIYMFAWVNGEGNSGVCYTFNGRGWEERERGKRDPSEECVVRMKDRGHGQHQCQQWEHECQLQHYSPSSWVPCQQPASTEERGLNDPEGLWAKQKDTEAWDLGKTERYWQSRTYWERSHIWTEKSQERIHADEATDLIMKVKRRWWSTGFSHLERK